MKETMIKNTSAAANGSTRFIYLPARFVQDMGVNNENPEVVMEYDYETKVLTIKKAGEE